MATKSSDKSSVKTSASAAKSRTPKAKATEKATEKATTKPAAATAARAKKAVTSTKPVAKSSTKPAEKAATKVTSKPATKPATKPAASKTAASKPTVAARTSKPAASKPAASKPAATKPAASKPVAKAKPAPVVEATPVELSEEERELMAVYGDDIGQPGLAHGEFKDQRTADEDRPMTPEISARDERNKRWDERRDSGRRHRRERGRDRDRSSSRDGAARPENGGGNGGGAPSQARPPREVAPSTPRQETAPTKVGPLVALMVAAIDAGPHRVGTSAGDGAAVVFAQLRNAQPMPVKQLAAMMRKRGLIEGDPELVWPGLKSALLADERSYRVLGLRPRLVYRGRDQFGPGPVTQSASGAAEAALAGALSGVAAATHITLRQRLAGANSAGFERLCDAYLTASGYRDLVWLKRVDGISYATALPPQGDRTILVSARSGDTQVDRRGVGELRVGVDAKGLLYGLLLSARELSPDAERELERPGRSIQVLGGDALVGALVGAGVGVVAAAAPVRYVDDQLLDELLAG